MGWGLFSGPPSLGTRGVCGFPALLRLPAWLGVGGLQGKRQGRGGAMEGAGAPGPPFLGRLRSPVLKAFSSPGL